MKKLLILFSFIIYLNISFGQTTLTGTITGLQYNSNSNAYSEQSSTTYIGQQSSYYYYVLCVFDLSQLGDVSSVSSGSVVLDLDQL